MPLYKVTMFINSGITGVSESYYLNAASPAAATPLARNLAKARIALCAADVDMPGIRVSNIDIRGDSVLDPDPGYTTALNHPPLIQIKNSDPVEKPDVTWTACIFTISKNNVAVGRIFARALADEMFVGDKTFIPTPQWKHFFNTFAKVYSAPANGWGVLRKAASTPANTFRLTHAVSLTGVNVTMTVSPGFFAVPGDVVAVRGLKSNQGTLNGTFIVVSFGGAVLEIAKVFLTPTPLFTDNTGTVQLATKTFITEPTISYGNATSRKAGGPFGKLVGRRKRARQLL